LQENWLKLKIIMLSKASQAQKAKYHVFLMNTEWRGHCFFTPSFVRASFLSHSWLLSNPTMLNWGQLEIQKKYRIDRQKVGSGLLSTQVEMSNPHCFFALSLFFKALLLAVL
jgi:hypothetical protein